MMETAGQASYRQLAQEIGEVLQAAAETAEKMQDDARIEAARIRAEAEADRRSAYAEGRRILDEARMEADMVRAEAEWQAQELIAQARRQAAERLASADTRLTDLTQAESRVVDRLAGVGQVLSDALAALREGAGTSAAPSTLPACAGAPADNTDQADHPTAKVYFVEFPPAAPVEPAPGPAAPEPEVEIVLTDPPGAGLPGTEDDCPEWAPPAELPAWWTRDGAQG
jgi:vacuolar-type H+-ATPase subunit E/Vma4